MSKKWPIILILLLSAVLRLWSLDSFPTGLNADEAAIGYNAYSLIQTGKDEYGEAWPLIFKSFADYKPGLYFYLSLPFVAIFGLNEWVVRLPSAILGVMSVYLIYLITKKVIPDGKAALLSALLLAISPWHIHFSRGGWETNAATFFLSLGIYLFILSLENIRKLPWSMLSFLVAMYTYQSPRLIVPVMLLVLLVIYRKTLLPGLLRVKLGLVLVAILSIPLILQFTSGQGNARFSGLTFFSDLGPIARVNELRGEHQDPTSPDAYLVHNKVVSLNAEFLRHYLDHFSANFLFINGDPLIRNSIPETGQFYLIEALFLFSGLYFFTKKRLSFLPVLLVWILTAPLASATTYQTPHALRALSMVVPITVVMAGGLAFFIQELKNRKIKVGFYLLVAVILLFEVAHYLESYYVHYPQRFPLAWEHGFKEMVIKLNSYENSYEKVVITNRYDQPYILVLFYKKYDPVKYQPQAKLTERDKFNFGTVLGFDKYQFRRVEASEIKADKDSLYIISPEELPEDVTIIDRVNFPNGQPAFLFIAT